MSFRGRKFSNSTIDVLNKGCFAHYDALACVRSSVLSTAAGITVVFVFAKILKYHVFKHRQMQHYAIFYITAVEILVCISHFLVGHIYPQLEFSANFLKLLQFSVLCHLHWSTSARAHGREGVVQHAINPGLCLYTVYCVAVALMGMVDITTTWNECRKPYWLMLSAVDLLAVEMFAVIALYISHIVEGLPSMTFRSAQRRDLLTVVIAYQISAVFSVLFDLLMRFVGSEESGCSGVFGHSQVFYSATELVFNTGKYFIPTWAILVVFRPVDDSGRSGDSVQGAYSLDGTPTSVRSSIRGFHQYQRMTVPSIFATDSPPQLFSLSQHSPPAAGHINRVNDSFTSRGFDTMATISEESSINCSDSIYY